MVSGSTLDISLPTGLLPRNAPERTASIWTRYKFQQGALKGVVIGGGWNWRGKSPAEVANQIIFPASSTIDAFAQYHWGKYRFSSTFRTWRTSGTSPAASIATCSSPDRSG
jgi:iron complex outermembrane receptor protein